MSINVLEFVNGKLQTPKPETSQTLNPSKALKPSDSVDDINPALPAE